MNADAIETGVLATRDEFSEVGKWQADGNPDGDAQLAFPPCDVNIARAARINMLLRVTLRPLRLRVESSLPAAPASPIRTR